MKNKGWKDSQIQRGDVVVFGEDGVLFDDSPAEQPVEVPLQPVRTAPREPLEQRERPMPEEPSLFEDEEPQIIRIRDVDDVPGAKDERQDKKRSRRRKMPVPGMFARAIGFLSRRDYSRRELARRLNNKLEEGETIDEVNKTLDRLEQLGYLSDERFARTRARVRANQHGDARIRYELRRHGVSDENIREAVDEISEPEEVRALRVWKRRFKALPEDQKTRDKQIRYLMYRGFSMDSIDRVLRGRVELPEDEITSYWD